MSFSKWRKNLYSGSKGLLKLNTGYYRYECTRVVIGAFSESDSMSDVKDFISMCKEYGYLPLAFVYSSDCCSDSTLVGSTVIYPDGCSSVVDKDITLVDIVSEVWNNVGRFR